MECIVCGNENPPSRRKRDTCSAPCEAVDGLRKLQAAVITELMELLPVKQVVRKIRRMPYMWALNLSEAQVREIATANGITPVPPVDRELWLRKEDGSVLPRNQMEVMRLMVDSRYACPADHQELLRCQAEYIAEERAAVAKEGGSVTPCCFCRSDVYAYCRDTGTECQRFEVWAHRNCIPGNKQFHKINKEAEAW